MIVETLSGRPVEKFVERVVVELATLALLTLGQNLRLDWSQYAVKTPQHRHRQHDALVLRRPVRAP